ncbi:MAG: heavy-metal-associated domain-containing protein, partial [Coriobacteriales bacterium]|nr:heavy-metal-associated domain-containing protein [Coriobacteriales bacterium]
MATVTQQIAIGGMTCAACAARIERGLGKLGAVEQVQVNYATEQARVSYDDAQLSLPELQKAVEKIGYEVLGIALEPPAPAAESRHRDGAGHNGDGSFMSGHNRNGSPESSREIKEL